MEQNVSSAVLAKSEGTADEANVDGVTEFLQDKVSALWRAEQTATPGLPTSGAREPVSLTEHRDRVAELNQPVNGSGLSREGMICGRAPTWKRVLDLTLIILASPVWLPLTLLLILAVRLSSPGPIFYRQARVGYRGRRFMIYKFRSMKVDAETQVHEAHFERLMKNSVPMMKLDGKGDPRILPWGRLMRATGLDELPQLFNVIRGEMSLVGPRPCTVHEFARYAAWQKERVNALPGLTGYWQVNGKNRTTFNEMIEMDIHYSKRMSVGFDLTILFQTLPALIDQTLETFGGSRNMGRTSFRPEVDPSEGI